MLGERSVQSRIRVCCSASLVFIKLSKVRLHSSAFAIFLVFFFESSVLGQWIPRIPDIKASLSLSDGGLGLALLALPLGTLLGFSVVGRIIERMGLRTACRVFLPAWALLFIGPAFAQTFWQLFIALSVCGIAVGMIETAMNTEAARIERDSGTRLMSRCHGFWSLGTMFGALMGGALAQWGVPVTQHFSVAMVLIALCGYFSATALPTLAKDSRVKSKHEVKEVPQEDGTVEPSTLFRWPARSIVLLCIMPVGIMMVEGAFIDWSAVFMRDIMSAEPLLIGITYAAFSLIMATVRLFGDSLAVRFGDLNIVRVSGIASTAGIALFALAPSIPWAFAGAALSGAGVAIVFPLAVTAAANRPGRSSADNVAALNMLSFSAFLIAPPIIGFVSEFQGLRVALLMLVPVALMTVLLAKEVMPHKI
ncbi:MAG: MFS family permease [Granulosicoccus sp.]